MACVSDNLRLTEKQDRRIKLTSEAKEGIRGKYATGVFSMMDLARAYNVSKKTILLIVNPRSKQKNDQYIKDHWKYYQQSKEDRMKASQNTRKYKKMLYLKGELK